MTREAFDLMISDHVEFMLSDDKTYRYVCKLQSEYMKEEYPPASGRDKGIKELCNVLCAYSDAMDDAKAEGYDIEPEIFGNLCYEVMMELLGKE